jgi:hypothetical protein
MPAVNKIVPIGLASAAVVAVLVVGLQLIRPSGSAGVGGQPATTPTATPTPVPSAASLPSEGPVEAGTYVTTDGVSSVRLTVPDGWSVTGSGTDLRKNTDGPDEVSLFFFPPRISVFPDACTAGERPPTTGPTLEDLVAALQEQAGTDVTEPEPITIEGAAGVRLTLTVPADFDYASCTDGAAKVWSTTGPPNYLAFGPSPDRTAQSATITILESPSGRIVYTQGIAPGASDADRAELAAIVDSIAVVPTP